MRTALDKVRKTLSRQNIVNAFTHYLLKGKRIYASDGRMMASAPFPSDIEALVPGNELELLVDRLGDKITMTLDGDVLKLSAGRQRGSIAILPPEEFGFPIPPEAWNKPPVSFLSALRTVRPFISDNATKPWALCAALYDGYMVGTTNVCLVEVACAKLKGNGTLVPCWAIDYLLSRTEPLVGMQAFEGALAWKWEDGSWMRTQLVQGDFPPAALKILADLTPPAWAISEEWRKAYVTMSGMTTDVMEVHAERLCGKTGGAVSEYDVESPVPAAGVSRWTTKFLDPVLNIATHWQPDAWPNPAPFVGPGIRGVIMGRS